MIVLRESRKEKVIFTFNSACIIWEGKMNYGEQDIVCISRDFLSINMLLMSKEKELLSCSAMFKLKLKCFERYYMPIKLPLAFGMDI